MEVQKTALGAEQSDDITADFCHYYNMKKKTIIKPRSQLTMSFLTESHFSFPFNLESRCLRLGYLKSAQFIHSFNKYALTAYHVLICFIGLGHLAR